MFINWTYHWHMVKVKYWKLGKLIEIQKNKTQFCRTTRCNQACCFPYSQIRTQINSNSLFNFTYQKITSIRSSRSNKHWWRKIPYCSHAGRPKSPSRLQSRRCNDFFRAFHPLSRSTNTILQSFRSYCRIK